MGGSEVGDAPLYALSPTDPTAALTTVAEWLFAACLPSPRALRQGLCSFCLFPLCLPALNHTLLVCLLLSGNSSAHQTHQVRARPFLWLVTLSVLKHL